MIQGNKKHEHRRMLLSALEMRHNLTHARKSSINVSEFSRRGSSKSNHAGLIENLEPIVVLWDTIEKVYQLQNTLPIISAAQSEDIQEQHWVIIQQVIYYWKINEGAYFKHSFFSLFMFYLNLHILFALYCFIFVFIFSVV